MRIVLNSRRTILLLGLLGLGALVVCGYDPAARAQTKAGDKAADKALAKGLILPPPADANELSMEVAALRTLYLLKTGDDQTERPAGYWGPWNWGKGAESSRQRQQAKVSPRYLKTLTELRNAFVANQEDRILELSEQIEQLTEEEHPFLDDKIEISDLARKNSVKLLGFYDSNRIAGYLAAYGKDFPDPFFLMYKTMRLSGKGDKPTPEQWKEIRDFCIQEVSWELAGFDAARKEKVAEQAAKLLDRAYTLSNPDLQREGSVGGRGLRGGISALILNNCSGPMEMLQHVLERDLAELLSNPRLLPAVDARTKYLKSRSAD
jgi:hypothetical protein